MSKVTQKNSIKNEALTARIHVKERSYHVYADLSNREQWMFLSNAGCLRNPLEIGNIKIILG